MREISATVENQALSITDRAPVHVAGTVGAYRLKLTFDDEWGGLAAKIVTFRSKAAVRTVLYDSEDGVNIPWEALAAPGKLLIGVIGTTTDGSTVLTTASKNDENVLEILPATTVETNISTLPPEPSPSVAAQLQAQIGDLSDLSTTAKDNLVAAINEVFASSGGTDDFNELSNRPKYAGVTMTGETNIPAVPTVDAAMSSTSTNPVQNKVINSALGGKQDVLSATQLNAVNSGITATDVSKLSGIAAGAEVNVQSDWNETDTDSDAYIKNKPTIPATQIQSDWTQNDNTKLDYIKNKPSLATVATSGSYADLSNTPTIPTVNDATLTVTQNGTSAGTFTANSSTDTTIALTDTTYSDFIGTDGTAAGVAGLVPAPATTDAGKFLKADGTWDNAGGGTLYSTVGNNTDGAMTQKATTEMIYTYNSSLDQPDGNIRIGHGADMSSGVKASSGSGIVLGRNAYGSGYRSISIGGGDNPNEGASATSDHAIAIGNKAQASGSGSVVLGQAAQGTHIGAVALGQNAISKGNYSICLGTGANTGLGASGNIVVGRSASATMTYGIALGWEAKSNATDAIAIGAKVTNSEGGTVKFESSDTSYGYNGTGRYLIRGIHDGQDLHDAATLAQGNTLSTSAPTTSTVGVLGQLYTDTTNMHTYQLTAIDTTDPSNPVYTWTQRW